MEKLSGSNYMFDGQSLYSYGTKVAEIQDGKLVELGKWSTTTSAHVTKCADRLGISKVPFIKKK